ncbi:MAG: valine--tRNA ligase [Rickettsiales bacterium]|jgi:valyl-tRNA synthetase|nr:valine--tRNA ligase [Rickettsiales bacterium]
MSYKEAKELDAKFEPAAIESRCVDYWEAKGVYKFDASKSRGKTFTIDTPPPTVSGSLHIGHIMSYSQADILARYQRMKGMNMFFPIGWDDNGLPTERRVQNYFNIKCDPTVPYDADFRPEHKDKFDEPPKPASRQNFIEACQILVEQDEKVFEDVFRRMGFSYDWGLKYTTISQLAIRVAQEAFVNLYKTGNVKSVDSPTMWDTGFQTAVAQAEIEDREVAGFFHDIKFKSETGDDFVIATTRPEFLPACIAIVAHPDDARYKHLIGKNAIVPLFGHQVPIYGDEHADPEKGTGVMMVCTFGDAEDVKFWKTRGLPLRQIIGRDGRIVDFGFLGGNESFKKMIGLPVKAARKTVVEMLRESGDLVGEPRPITHAVKFYEKGDVPIEFVPSRQWFVSLLDKKEALKKNGNEILWTPEHMGKRLDNWIDGLNQDWAISRQRFFGVPFPVWYGLNAAGEPDFDNPIIAETLPCDPLASAPAGYDESQRGQPNGFIGDPDVMDTWATSSLTPKIAQSVAGVDLGTFDARPQAHDIIRTWAFYTIAQSLMNDNILPWKQAWISGFVLDPDRKKMSKSKGNVVVPDELVAKYGADAIRLWAASSKLGMDGTADEKFMEQKRKLVMKFFNASKFVFGFPSVEHAPVSSDYNPVDLAYLAKLDMVIKSAEKAFSENDYTGALIATEQAFWDFCDNYLEIVKGRAYAGDKSALGALMMALETFCALFAPFMPFITEEVSFAHPWNKDGKSIHTVLFPSMWMGFIPDEFVGKTAGYESLRELVAIVRGRKSTENKSMKFPIAKLTIADNEFLRAASADIKNVLTVTELNFEGNDLVAELIWGEVENKGEQS